MQRCKACVGSGKVLGGGMITKDCDNCCGTGKLAEIKIDKRSKEYRESVNRIKDKYKDKSTDDIESVLDKQIMSE